MLLGIKKQWLLFSASLALLLTCDKINEPIIPEAFITSYTSSMYDVSIAIDKSSLHFIQRRISPQNDFSSEILFARAYFRKVGAAVIPDKLDESNSDIITNVYVQWDPWSQIYSLKSIVQRDGTRYEIVKQDYAIRPATGVIAAPNELYAWQIMFVNENVRTGLFVW